MVLDFIPCMNNNEAGLSLELRAIHTMLYIVKSLIPVKKTWPILNNCIFSLDIFYLTVFNRICDYGMGTIVTIPRLTNITHKTLHKTHFIITCLDKLKDKYDITVNLNNKDCENYKEFIPRDVNYMWIAENDEIEENIQDKYILYLHGGGYTLGGASHVGYVSRLSGCTNIRALFIDYEKPPIADIPYQVDQVITIYLYLLLHQNIDPKRIVIMGDSAGGGLCTLFVQKLSLLKLSVIHPLGMILFSPWVDLTLENDTWIQCQYHDLIVCNSYTSRSALIAAGNKQNNLRSPFFSAIYAPQHHVGCNVMIFVSKHECLYDDSQQLVEKLRNNNVFHECKTKNMEDEYDEKDINFVEDTNFSLDGKSDEIVTKELIYHQMDHMPHAFVIFHSVFPEANDAMDKVCQTLDKWFSRKIN